MNPALPGAVRPWLRRCIQRSPQLLAKVLGLVLVVLLGGFAAAALVRYSPGFDVDENAWNPRIGPATLAVMHARRQAGNRLPLFYGRYLLAAIRGDFGQSDSFHAPVADLLRERAPVSARLLGWGTAGGLLLGAAMAWLAVWPRRQSLGFLTAAASGLLLATPPAVLALAFFFAEAPLGLAVAFAIQPRVYGTLRALLEELHDSPALLAARARGLPPFVLGFRYVLGAARSRFAALTGVALVLAFGCLTPIEALCDIPGIGQLAWKAATARDLPLLSAIALIVTFLVASVQTLGDLVAGGRD